MSLRVATVLDGGNAGMSCKWNFINLMRNNCKKEEGKGYHYCS